VVVFVTFNVRNRCSVLSNPALHEAFLASAREANAWRIGEYVIMPDHVHLFCGPATVPCASIAAWVRFLKSRVSVRVAGNAWKWQADFWDTQMRSGRQYAEKWAYVKENPVRKQLVQKADQWPYQGIINELRW
jgi:putative transposase